MTPTHVFPQPVEAWHFIKPNKKLRFEPFSDVVVGETLRCHETSLDLCAYGLHASIRPIDALSFVSWNDAIICRVELSGKIVTGDDKLCASERKVLWMAPADKTLHEFACRCAEDVLHLFEYKYPNDKRPRLAIEAKRKWIKGEISNEELAAARAAARAAAGAAAGDAARAVAGAVAGDAARAAARAAAGDAAGAAAWDAAYERFNGILHDMFMELKPAELAREEK